MNSRPSYSLHDVSLHNKSDDLWVIVDDKIFDLTKYMDEHPGGKKGCISIYYLLTSQDLDGLFETRSPSG